MQHNVTNTEKIKHITSKLSTNRNKTTRPVADIIMQQCDTQQNMITAQAKIVNNRIKNYAVDQVTKISVIEVGVAIQYTIITKQRSTINRTGHHAKQARS